MPEWHLRKRFSTAEGLWNSMLSFSDWKLSNHHRSLSDNLQVWVLSPNPIPESWQYNLMGHPIQKKTRSEGWTWDKTCHGLVKTGSEISQLRQTSWGDRDPSNYLRNSAEKISSCQSRCLAFILSPVIVCQAVQGVESLPGKWGMDGSCSASSLTWRWLVTCKQWEGGGDIIIITCVSTHQAETSIHWLFPRLRWMRWWLTQMVSSTSRPARPWSIMVNDQNKHHLNHFSNKVYLSVPQFLSCRIEIIVLLVWRNRK